MESLEHLFKLPTNLQDENLLNITQSWFSLMHANPMAELMRLCQLPFLNVRCAALAIVRSIADQPWGQRTLHNHPGFQVGVIGGVGKGIRTVHRADGTSTSTRRLICALRPISFVTCFQFSPLGIHPKPRD